MLEQGAFALSPDGEEIAYFLLRRSRGSSHPDALVISGVDGSGMRVLKEFVNNNIDLGALVRFGYVSFSPDGSQLLYIPPDSRTPVLKLFDLTTGKETVLFEDVSLGQPGHRPAWSPDGRYIALATARQLYILTSSPNLPENATPLRKVYESSGQPFGSVQWVSGFNTP